MELKIINNQKVMNKKLKFGIVMQPSSVDVNAFGSGDEVGRFVITGSDGDDQVVVITDPQDILEVEALMPKVKSGDEDALRKLAPIIQEYDSAAAARLWLRTRDYGEALLAIGDSWEEQSMEEDAFDAYKESAKYGYACGMCKLGRYYAQGIGCKKNKKLAKKWLEEAAQECSDAEKYLDQYGLR